MANVQAKPLNIVLSCAQQTKPINLFKAWIPDACNDCNRNGIRKLYFAYITYGTYIYISINCVALSKAHIENVPKFSSDLLFLVFLFRKNVPQFRGSTLLHCFGCQIIQISNCTQYIMCDIQRNSRAHFSLRNQSISFCMHSVYFFSNFVHNYDFFFTRYFFGFSFNLFVGHFSALFWWWNGLQRWI